MLGAVCFTPKKQIAPGVGDCQRQRRRYKSIVHHLKNGLRFCFLLELLSFSFAQMQLRILSSAHGIVTGICAQAAG